MLILSCFHYLHRCECHGHADHCDTSVTPYRCLCLPESHTLGNNVSNKCLVTRIVMEPASKLHTEILENILKGHVGEFHLQYGEQFHLLKPTTVTFLIRFQLQHLILTYITYHVQACQEKHTYCSGVSWCKTFSPF